MTIARTGSWTLLAVLSLSFSGCAADSGDEPQEPVAPTTEQTPYPEDPDMAPKADDGAAAKNDIPDGVGELTQDPFADKTSPDATDDAIAQSTPDDDVLPPPDAGDSMSGALENNDSMIQNTPDTTPEVPGEATPSPSKVSKAKKAKGAKATAQKGKKARYVDAVMLNVRAKPNKSAPVVRRLLGGAMIRVEMHGKWAKIKNGQWVRTRYLATSPTRKVSRAEAEKAWHHSKAGKKTKTAKSKAKKSKVKEIQLEAAPAPAADESPAAEPDALPEDPASN